MASEYIKLCLQIVYKAPLPLYTLIYIPLTLFRKISLCPLSAQWLYTLLYRSIYTYSSSTLHEPHFSISQSSKT